MGVGDQWMPEYKSFCDPVTGVRIQQLTDYKGHSHHLYFTNLGWYDSGRKVLFGSDRNNRTNLFSLDLETKKIQQLTDLEPIPPPLETEFMSTCVNPIRDEVYFWYGNKIIALDLHSLEQRALWEMPEGFMRIGPNCTADGKYVCAGIMEDLSDRIKIDLLRGYVGFKETFEAQPLSRIVCINTDGSGAKTVWEEKSWIGHINTSPTQLNLLTFCHEGPWDRVDNRIWCLDLNTQKAWMLRERESLEIVGHEYWHADGIHIGYHGKWEDGRKFFGRILYDNTEKVEVDFPYETGHIHSNDITLVVGDGNRDGKVIRLWKWNGKGYENPRILCEHRSSFHIQQVHVHPRFSPDGKKVLFTSDMSGYGNIYLVDVPDFECLPELKE